MKKRLAISLAWPVFVAALFCAVLIYAVEINNARQRVESAALEDTNGVLTHLQNMLNSQLTSGNSEDARLSFSVSAMHKGMQKLLLSDERDQVVLASRYIWEGLPASTLGHYDSALAKQVRLDANSIVKLSENGNHLLGYYPVTLKIVENELGKKKLGVLYFEYDLSLSLEESRQEATNMALLTGLLLLLSAAATTLLLRRLISQRIVKLVSATDQFARGDLNARAHIAGNDEIALLGRAFDEMVAQRGKFETDLQIKNTAIETSINAIAIVDLEGKHTYVNRAMLEMWRLPSADFVLGRSPQEFVANPEQLIPLFEGVHRCGQWRGELAILRHDGSKIDVQVSAHLITDAKGQPAGMMGSFVDISERIQADAAINAARAQLEATIEAIPDLLFDLNLEGVYFDVHAQNAELLAAPENKLVGKTVNEMLPAAAAAVVMNAVNEANEKGRSFGKQFELNLPTGDFWFELSVARKKSIAGESPRFIVLSRDITDRKRAIERLKNYNDELEQRVEERTHMLNTAKQEAERANEAKSLFLSSMSHELRTPLNAIMGYAQLMEMTPELTGDMRENAREMRRAGNLLLDLVNDIIDLARIESGRLELKLEKCALIDTLSECNSQNSRAAEKRRIKLMYDPSCNTVQLIADRRRLLQIFNNLISNAIKYNREGGAVTLSCTLPTAGFARIEVVDTGSGISAEALPQLFQHFSRLGAELSQIEGTGIGLVITRHLVEGMGGKIGVESTRDKGSTFWIMLPTDSRPALTQDEVLDILINKGGKPRILVAEDYPQNQNLLRIQLAKLGCEVDMVANGAEALQKSRSEIYDLILTDLNMPQMDGTAFAMAVREDELHSGTRTPIVAVTAAAEPSELSRCRDAGMDDVLTKPVSIQALRRVLERWLGLSQEDFNTDVLLSTETAAILNFQHIYSILGQANIEQARSLIETFIQTTKIELQRITVDAVDEMLVVRELHKQKSSAKTAGAMRYALMAENLELRIKNGLSGNLKASLRSLSSALHDVEQALHQSGETQEVEVALPPSPSKVKCSSVLVVDDDLVVLQQMAAMLNLLGVDEVLLAANGFEAIDVLAARSSDVEVMICDLDMPGMDGVELIREFSHTGFEGGLIFMSGADEKVLGTVSKLASLQGLRVLGQLSKPVTPAQMAALLSTEFVSPVPQNNAFAPFDVSPEAIRIAMLNDEFSIWLQPKVDSATLKPVGMEALARWKNAEGRFVPPDLFITVAEQSDLIADLSQLLVFKALEEGAKVFEAGFPLKIAINLSGRWLNDLNLPDFVRTKTLAVGLKTEDVMLEVTETGVMEDLTTALDVLTRLRIKGFGLSIDDFGIGYSSFEQLGRIPFNEMKLDRSFVSKGATDPAARAILESSMDMAQKLGLSTVAEGVETEKDLELIRTLGCERVQGYLIAKPMPLNELLEWLKTKQNE